MVRRAILVIAVGVVCVALTACDSYVERLEVGGDGSARLQARAQLVCDDPLLVEIWGGSPCDAADQAARGDTPELPLGPVLDGTGLVVDVSGERRQTIDLSWEGNLADLPSALVGEAEVRTVDDSTRELILTPAGSAVADFVADAESARRVAIARWPDAELHVVSPDLIVEHNADEITGRTVIWTIDGDQPEELRLRWTVEDPPRQYWWWLVGSVLMTGLLFMMVVLEGSRGRNDNRRQVGGSDGPGGDGGRAVGVG